MVDEGLTDIELRVLVVEVETVMMAEPSTVAAPRVALTKRPTVPALVPAMKSTFCPVYAERVPRLLVRDQE